MSFGRFTRKQWCILFLYSAINLFASFSASVPISFFPLVAENKGATPSQYGLVVGVFGLSVSLIVLFYGKLIPVYGPIFICITGLLTTGVTNILFGFINMVNGPDIFIGLSIVIRLVEGVGFAAFRSASLCLISNEFSDDIEIAFSIFQSCMTAGLIIGPTAGGALYELGGFMLPFLFIGILNLGGLLIIFIIPNSYYKKELSTNFNLGYCNFLKNNYIITALIVAFGVYLNVGVILTLLETHLKPLNLTPTKIGMLFLCNALSLAITSSFWAKLCESYLSPHYVWSIGAIFIIVALMILGPVPYFPFQMNIYTCITSLLIHGIGESAEILASFAAINRAIASAGMINNLISHGLISTLFVCSISLGGFAGSTLGGFLYEYIGFCWGVHVYMLYHLIIIIWSLTFTRYYIKKEEILKEMESLPVNYDTISYRSLERQTKDS